ncbi:MAG TPA: OmpH family outer membrane protein [Aliidongia sp.]|nr:OmpH family outer membrane protein [Aliidongia sp.]
MFRARQLSAIAVAAVASSFLGTAAWAQAPAAPAGAPVTLPPPTAAAKPAGPVPAPQIMVVNADGVLGQSKAMKGLQAQLDAQKGAFQKELAKTEDDLQSTKQELTKEQGTMSADAFEEKRHAFEKRFAEAQKETQLKRQSLEQGAQDSLNKVKGALLEIVRDVAEEHHSNLVLQTNVLLIFDPVYDASAEVLKRLDQKMPEVKLVLGKPADGQAVPTAPAPTAQNTPKKK